MRKIIQNALGLGLVEVLMAAGIAGGIALTVAKLSQDANKVTKTTEANNEINMFLSDVAYALSDKENCRNSIIGIPPSGPSAVPANGTVITNIYRKGPPPGNTPLSVYATGRDYGNNLFTIVSMQTEYSAPNVNFKVTIRRKNAVTNGAKEIIKKIPLKAVVDASGNITSCFSDTENMVEDAARAACHGNSARWDDTQKQCHHDINLNGASGTPLSCPNGQAPKQIDLNNGTVSLECRPVSTTTCLSGQYLSGFDSTSGAPVCSDFPCGNGQVLKKTGPNSYVCIPLPNCGDNQILFFKDDQFQCANSTCGANKYIQGINSNGSLVCKSLPTSGCPTNQYVTEVKVDGTVSCAPVPAGTNLAQNDFSFVDGYNAGTDTWSRKTILQTAQQICATFPTFTWNGSQCIPSTVGDFVTKAELAALKPNSVTAIHRSWIKEPWNDPNAGATSPNNDWNGGPSVSVCGSEITLHSYTIPSANYNRLIEADAFITFAPDDSNADTIQFRFNVDSFVAQRTTGRAKDGWNATTIHLKAVYTVYANQSAVIRIYGVSTQGGCGTVFNRPHMWVKEL